MVHSKESRQRAQLKLLERKANWLSQNGPCYCGSWLNLEVHHKDPKDKESHNVWSWTKQRMEAELAKCIALCEKCHKQFHKWTYFSVRKHGTKRMYEDFCCRCILCKTWRRNRTRKYRANKRLQAPLV